MKHIEAEHPRPRHFLLHLSDPHLLGGPDPLYGAVDSEAKLIQLFDEVRASGARPEAVIFTGDLADQGHSEAYAKLRAIVDPACEDLGAQCHLGDGKPRQPGQLPDRPAGSTGQRCTRGPQLLHQRPAHHHHGYVGPGLPPRRAEYVAAGVADPRVGYACTRWHHPGAPPSTGPIRPGPFRAGGAAGPGKPGRRGPQLGRPDHPRRAPALLNHGELRGDSCLRGLGHVLHPGPQCGGRRHPRKGRCAGLQPGARLRTHHCPLRGSAGQHPHRGGTRHAANDGRATGRGRHQHPGESKGRVSRQRFPCPTLPSGRPRAGVRSAVPGFRVPRAP